MNIYALDSNFNMVSIGIPYSDLSWTRKYYDFGEFNMTVPISVYDTSWEYIGTDERKELGIIQKIIKPDNDNDYVTIWGFFLEKLLDYKACYPRYKGNVAQTETAVRNIFSAFKDDLNIKLGAANNPLLGNRTESDFSDDRLGTKLYSICESREISYSVVYDYDANDMTFKVWQGKDRTQSQSLNTYQVFSLEFGNIGASEVNLDSSDYYNYAIVPCNGNNDNVEQNVYYVDLTNGEFRREIVLDHRGDKPEENESMDNFRNRIIEEATLELLEYLPIEEIDVSPLTENEYMIDYDLGDKCDVILSNLGISFETRIVEIEETFTPEGHTIKVGLGNKRITSLGRLANRV